MLKKILIVLLILIAGVLVYASFKPDNFEVKRSITINTSADKIYKELYDFHNWTAWSPWEKMDPEMTRMYSGSKNGKGAIYSWESNSGAGTGSMEISQSDLNSFLSIDLEFKKPMKTRNVVEFSLHKKDNGTELTWLMKGKQNFIGKVFSIFMNMDKMVGRDFEKGLNSLKTNLEK